MGVAQFGGNVHGAGDKLHTATDHCAMTHRVAGFRFLIDQIGVDRNARSDSRQIGAIGHVITVYESRGITRAEEWMGSVAGIAILEDHRKFPGIRSFPNDHICGRRLLVRCKSEKPVESIDLDEKMSRQVEIHSRAENQALRLCVDVAEGFIREPGPGSHSQSEELAYRSMR